MPSSPTTRTAEDERRDVLAFLTAKSRDYRVLSTDKTMEHETRGLLSIQANFMDNLADWFKAGRHIGASTR